MENITNNADNLGGEVSTEINVDDSRRISMSVKAKTSGSNLKAEEVINAFMKNEKLLKENKDEDKVTIQFKAAGNAPVLKQNKIKLGGFNRFAAIGDFLKSALKNVIKENESLFLYCNSNFAPAPNTYVRDLYNNFAVSGELIVYYALTEAWG